MTATDVHRDADGGVPGVVHTRDELRSRIAALMAAAPAGAGLGLVPTMGALHDGHAALASAARTANDVVVASVFVNPLQFGDAEDLERYPRTFEADLELLGRCGVDLVFAPSIEQMYPGGTPLVRISSGSLGETFEGASRPGHFDGALTAVAKLLHLADPGAPRPFRAYFGQKDAQQLALVRRMVEDLNYRVRIEAVPIIRDDDGLARSSRNRFLSAAEREGATVLPRALSELARQAAQRLPLGIDEAVELIDSAPYVHLDYLEVVDPRTLEPWAENCRYTPFVGEALALVAARVGAVRLIDNMVLRNET